MIVLPVKALVIDDDDDVRFLLRTYLSKMPFINEVIEAEDGEIGLSKALSEKPDLIFLDLNMPRCNGFDFLNAYCKEHADVPIMVVSSEEESTINDALKLGARSALNKPIQSEILYLETSNILEAS